MAASSSTLLIISLLIFFPAAVDSQQCDQAINHYHDCLAASSRSASTPQEASKTKGTSTFQDMKNKIDQCFTSNHCKAPELGAAGSAGIGGATARSRPRQTRNSQTFDDNAARKCLQIVNNKTRDYMFSCMRKADPTFTFGKAGMRRRRREAKGGFRSPQDPQFLLRACDNNAASAAKVNACLADAFPNQKKSAATNEDKAKKCQTTKTCRNKYLSSACQSVLGKRNEAVCECGNELHDKRQQFMKQEPSCKDVLHMQRQRQGGAAEASGPGQAQRQDCTRHMDDCDQN